MQKDVGDVITYSGSSPLATDEFSQKLNISMGREIARPSRKNERP